MDPIEERRRALEEAAAKRRAAQAEETKALEHSIISDVTAEPPVEDLETARLRMELERQRLELERDKLLFERQKLEQERKGTSASGTRRPSERARRQSDRLRAGRPPSGEHAAAGGAGKSPRPKGPQRSSATPLLVLLVAVAAAAGTAIGVLFILRDRQDTPVVAAGETPEIAALRAKADAGDGEACLSLGLFLWNGVGVERNPAEAQIWLQRAAERGDARVSAEAVLALDNIRALERDQRQQAIQLAELEAQRERAQEREEVSRREAEQRRRRAEEERAAAEERQSAERTERHLAELKAQARALKTQLSSPVLPPVLRASLQRLDALVADRASDADLRRLAQEARDQAEIFRDLSAGLGVSEAGRLADDQRYTEALAMLSEVEAVLGVLPEKAQEERRRWSAAVAQASAAQAAAAEKDEPTPEGPEAPSGAFEGRAPDKILAAVRGHPATEDAVQKALGWLARHQSPDGRWDTDGWSTNCTDVRCSGPGANAGDARYDVGNTSLALLSFLGNGQTHRFGAFKQNVTKALQWLTRQQAADGSVGFDAHHGEAIYNHAIATMALCEAYAVSQDETLRPYAEVAVRFCVESQNAGQGWKYGVQSGRNDTSVTGWMVLALKAGQTAGIDVPDAAFAGARTWFMRATDTEGHVGYETPGGGSSFLGPNDGKYDLTPCMTAVAVMCRIFIGERRTEAALLKGTRILGENLPSWSDARNTRKCNMYYWYYGTYAMFQAGGNGWVTWNRALQSALLPHQRTGACVDGSWDPVCEWALAGGRVYATAISALTLEAYYRYERVDGAPAAGPAPGAATGVNGPPALAKVEADVRRRFASWVRIRGATALSCPRCRGTERVRCSDCGGDGINELQTVNGITREPCPSCTNGTGPCKDPQCLAGYDKQSLRTAFWDCRSQEGKRGQAWEATRDQLMRGELRGLVGQTLVIRSAEVTSIEILDDRVRVTATMGWHDEGRPRTWTSTWVRYLGRYYLATEGDANPDLLR
jgi:TPR repeat protein